MSIGAGLAGWQYSGLLFVIGTLMKGLVLFFAAAGGLLPGMVAAERLTEAGTPQTVELRLRATGTYYVPSQIAGLKPMNMLLDTGSSHVVISPQMLAELRLHQDVVEVRDINGRMADGSQRRVPLVRIPSLRLGENCWVQNVEAAVIAGSTRPIIGMSVLNQLAPFTLSTSPPSIALAGCGAAPVPTELLASAGARSQHSQP